MTGEPGSAERPKKSVDDSADQAQVAKRTAADAEAALRQFELDQARKRRGEPEKDTIAEKPLESEPKPLPKPAVRRRWFGLRQPTKLWLSLVLGAAMILMVAGIWWILTAGEKGEDRILSPTILPSIGETFGSFHELWFDRALTRNIWATISRVMMGFALATIVGVPLGVLAGCFAPVRAFLAPMVIFGRNIPIAALIPITMILFLDLDKYGETQKIMFIFIACVAFIIADTATAITDVAQKYVDTAYTLGATRWQVIIKVLCPLALPSVFNSLRLLFGLAFGYIMLAELFKAADATGGLGHLINTSQRRGKYEHIYLIVLIIPIIALAIDRILYWIQRQLFPYRSGSRGILHTVVRWTLAGWDDLKTKLFGPKPPFNKLVVAAAGANGSSQSPTSKAGDNPDSKTASNQSTSPDPPGGQ